MAIAVVLGGGAIAEAKECGGDVACACGDSVRGAATLDVDLTGCTAGLRVKSGATLDCAGHALLAAPLDAAEGIVVEGTAATVRNCTVAGFKTGIRVRAGGGSTIEDNDVVDSGRYGIELASATTRNVLRRNLVTGSGDEGIHVGSGADDNLVADNEITRSKRENLYMLDVSGCRIEGNVLRGASAAAMYVKHSSNNVFVDNDVADRPIQLRGESNDNVFTGNELDGVGFVLQAYKDAKRGWKAPRGNQVHGGTVRGVPTCFRFDGASYNVADGVATSGCKAMTQKKSGGLSPVGNHVETIRVP
ncbi:right-handed parallel beta-helix repeat-containing protein [Candidatus Binatia bacterium]|jgi:parallel beta-helix repeat protein|nr:right-handed parallel beta-helix repeat-containing protein [Candidatus Binatia bacterium]